MSCKPIKCLSPGDRNLSGVRATCLGCWRSLGGPLQCPPAPLLHECARGKATWVGPLLFGRLLWSQAAAGRHLWSLCKPWHVKFSQQVQKGEQPIKVK